MVNEWRSSQAVRHGVARRFTSRDTFFPPSTPEPETGSFDLAELLRGLRVEDESTAEGEERFRQLAEYLPGVLWLAHPVTGFIDYVSPGFEAIWGLTREALYADPALWSAQIHPEDRAEFRSRRAVREEPSDVTFRLVLPTGELRWIRCRRSPVFSATGRLHRLAGYSEDITQTRVLEASVERLSQLVQETRELERRRIARDLHDATGQNLAGVALALGALERYVPQDDARLQELLAQSRLAIEECGRDLSSFTHLLHPPQIAELGLIGAMRHYVNGFSERTGIQTPLLLSSSLAQLSPELGSAVMRIVQEALGNVRKHSGSATATVSVEVRDDVVLIQVKDRGRGLPPGLFGPEAEAGHCGVGLLGMRERARQFGGTMRLHSDHTGTTLLVTLRIPPRGD